MNSFKMAKVFYVVQKWQNLAKSGHTGSFTSIPFSNVVSYPSTTSHSVCQKPPNVFILMRNLIFTRQ